MNHRFPISVSHSPGYVRVSRLNLVLGAVAAFTIGFVTAVLTVGLIVTRS